MNEPLTDVEVRVLGSLIEKEMTTPDYYPLSLNALTNACNQSSNREPVVEYDENTVAHAVESLRRRSLVRSHVSSIEATVGRPMLQPYQWAPSLSERNTPRSVAATRVPGVSASTTRSFTGTSGRLPDRSSHVAPAFVVRKMCPRPEPLSSKPEYDTYAVCGFCGSTTRSLTARTGREPAFVPAMLCQDPPRSSESQTSPLSAPP